MISLTLISHGQKIDFSHDINFKSSSFFIVFLDKYKNFEMSSEEQSVEHKIIYTTKSFFIHGTNEKLFTLISKPEKWLEGSTQLYKWRAIDQDKKNVTLRMMVTIKGDPKGYTSIFYIDYSDKTCVFRVTIDN